MGKNIILIGMPGSGKTVTGKLLAGILGYGFVDTDEILIEKLDMPLPDVVRNHGMEYFLKRQGEIISGLDVSGMVIATGGSVVLNSGAMSRLKENGIAVYLKIELEELFKRLGPDRRLARADGQTIADVFGERKPFYEKYSDITIECTGREADDIAGELASKIVNIIQG